MASQIEVTVHGVKLSGSVEDVMNMANRLGLKVDLSDQYYHSSTHGYVRISEMTTEHLRNALLKIFRDYAISLSSLHGIQLVKTLVEGNVGVTFNALFAEYTRRVQPDANSSKFR